MDVFLADLGNPDVVKGVLIMAVLCLAAIVWAYRCLSRYGQDLKITGVQPMVRRLLDITGLATYLPLG